VEQSKLIIHPYVRLLFIISSFTGTILIDDSWILVLYYGIVILPLFIVASQVRQHINMILFGMVPIFLSFVLLYLIALNGSSGGWNFIVLKMLKLIMFTSAIQLTLSIPSEHLIITFKKWGLNGEALITLLGAFTVWVDMNSRAGKIITARFSRGFIEKRTVFNTAKQFPFVLIPLIISMLRTSTERAELWEQKNILRLLSNVKVDNVIYPFYLSAFLSTVSLAWMVFSVIYIIKT
jgi:hypothetical protein